MNLHEQMPWRSGVAAGPFRVASVAEQLISRNKSILLYCSRWRASGICVRSLRGKGVLVSVLTSNIELYYHNVLGGELARSV